MRRRERNIYRSTTVESGFGLFVELDLFTDVPATAEIEEDETEKGCRKQKKSTFGFDGKFVWGVSHKI